MKIILTILIILSFALISFTPSPQDIATNAPIASVEYLDEKPPVERKVKKKKRLRKRFKHQYKQNKKQQKNNKREKLPIIFIILGSVLFTGFLAWAIYFFPLLASGALASSWGCLAPLALIIFGFLGIFLSIVLLVGAVLFIVFAILILNRNNSNKPEKASTSSSDKNPPREEDYIKAQIRDKASKAFPNLAPETLEKYINIKNSIVELKYDRSKLEATEVKDIMKGRLEGKINSIDRSIAAKEMVIATIEEVHEDLEPIPDSKRLAYTNIKIKLSKLKAKQNIYQQQNDPRALDKLRDVEEAIQEQEEELKLLLGIRKD
jgi:hypothetical protein